MLYTQPETGERIVYSLVEDHAEGAGVDPLSRRGRRVEESDGLRRVDGEGESLRVVVDMGADRGEGYLFLYSLIDLAEGGAAVDIDAAPGVGAEYSYFFRHGNSISG